MAQKHPKAFDDNPGTEEHLLFRAISGKEVYLTGADLAALCNKAALGNTPDGIDIPKQGHDNDVFGRHCGQERPDRNQKTRP
ncbi:MAG TPA: hypothetical protein ENH84_06325 [Phycisphaerae bacterium]|nr:hypothetical protein [Phycisphaerae bacterium]